jgi:phenylalanine-4-hydroxylase
MLSDAEWVIAQDWDAYTPAEHATWNALFARQSALLSTRAAPEFLDGVEFLRRGKPGIPDFADLSDRLSVLTGWSVVAVRGLIPDEVFFDNLARRRFVAGRFIRKPEQLDYLQEPDVFHDIFGHVPLLANPVFADYMQAYGEAGAKARQFGAIHRLARLYWYTVEFGLVREGDGLKAYGAGIVSSRSETLYALESAKPQRLAFDLKRVMRSNYKIDGFQQNYFVIDSFEQLLKETAVTDFAPLYSELQGVADIEAGEMVTGDEVISSAA